MVKKIKYAQDYEDDPIGSFADFVHNTYSSNIESFKQFCGLVQQRGTSTHLEKQFLAYAKANLLDETNSADNNNKSEDSVLAANEL